MESGIKYAFQVQKIEYKKFKENASIHIFSNISYSWLRQYFLVQTYMAN